MVVNHAQAVKRLSVSRDDLLIMSQVPTDMDLEFMPFLNNPIIAVAPAEHPLCHAATLSLQDLTSYPLLVREPGSGTRKAAEDYLRQKRAHFTQTIQVASLDALRECVVAGLGLALLPRRGASGAGRRPAAELPVAELPLYRSWCVHPRGKRLSPVAQAFFAFLREERAQISALAERFAGPPTTRSAS